MMTAEEFHSWCQQLQLSQETEALITAIRSSPPVRRVRGRASNVTGRYPSPKMGVAIQFESQHVELWAIYAMERDDEILEYYDQPSRIPLRYRAKSGWQTTQWHTPDFFVLRRESAGWEEWKPAQSLDTLVCSMPARYQQAGTGHWHCPPGEAYAEQFGLTYRLRSSAEYHPLEIENLKFLQDFWAHDVPPHLEQEALTLAHIQAYPGIRLSELLATYSDLPVDVLWVLLSTRWVFTDLSATLLMRHDQVALYAQEMQMRSACSVSSSVSSPALVSPLPTVPLAWDGRLWVIESLGELVQLRPEIGEPLILPLSEFERLQQEFVGALKYLLERVPLTCDLDAQLSRWRWFAEGSLGCIGILKTWLVDAVAAALTTGGTTLTEDILARTILHPAKRVSLEMEARAGEHEVNTRNTDSDRQLQLLLGRPGKGAAKPGGIAGNGSSVKLGLGTQPEQSRPAATAPIIAPKPATKHVGERGLGRDSVGEASALPSRKGAGCSFTGKIELLPRQMEAASVFHIECPQCLAVREVHPKGDRVTFSWHVKRVTNTPNHGMRWVRRGGAWELSEKQA